MVYLQQPSIPALSKIKAIFQLAPLSVLSTKDILAEAIEQSILALNTLQSMCSILEQKCNQHKNFFKKNYCTLLSIFLFRS